MSLNPKFPPQIIVEEISKENEQTQTALPLPLDVTAEISSNAENILTHTMSLPAEPTNPSMHTTVDAMSPEKIVSVASIVPEEIIGVLQPRITPVPFPPSFTPFHETENAVYGTINTADCFRSPEHTAMFNSTDKEGALGTNESYNNFGRLKPVFCFQRLIDDKPMCAIIDGNRYFEYAKVNGRTKIFVCIITINDTDEIVKIMAQLQFSNHNTYMSLFLIIQNLWPLFYKGQGYRTDLNDEQFDVEKPDGDGINRLNIYQKIGKEIGLSGNAVKFIRKIGIVNPLHFKQIETTRHSLYAAYLACKNEVAGNEPAPPKPKAPTFIRTSTNNPPEFSTTDSTGVVPPGGNLPVNNTPVHAATSVTLASDDVEYIIVRGICECCNQETNIRIPKSLCK